MAGRRGAGSGQAEKGTAGLSGPPVPEAPNLCFIASFLLTPFSGRNHVENNAQNRLVLDAGDRPETLVVIGFL